MPTSLFTCPTCRDVLEILESKAECTGCGTAYPLACPRAVDLLPDDQPSHVHQRGLETDFSPDRKPKGPISHHFGQRTMRQTGGVLLRQAEINGRALTVLDVGCGRKLDPTRGSGYIDLLVPAVSTYLGIDPSPICVEFSSVPGSNLSRFQRGEIARAVGERIPLPDGSVDAVLLISVIDHCAAPDLVLRECHRVLRPGATLLLKTGLRHSWLMRVMRRLAPRRIAQRDASDHHIAFTLDGLTSMVCTAGFDPIRLQEYGYVALPPQGRHVENAIALVGSALGRQRFMCMLEKIDDRAADRFAGFGSDALIIAQSNKN